MVLVCERSSPCQIIAFLSGFFFACLSIQLYEIFNMPSSNHAAFLKLLLNPKVGSTNQSKFSSALIKKKLSGELIDSRYSRL